uniref:Uncharacterized protein n=1 Tax=Octopus bimaculoides TaxID=37653 RepID=A0A0L8GYN2_OCTBM
MTSAFVLGYGLFSKIHHDLGSLQFPANAELDSTTIPSTNLALSASIQVLIPLMARKVPYNSSSTYSCRFSPMCSSLLVLFRYFLSFHEECAAVLSEEDFLESILDLVTCCFVSLNSVPP